jgi:hypothetical protein
MARSCNSWEVFPNLSTPKCKSGYCGRYIMSNDRWWISAELISGGWDDIWNIFHSILDLVEYANPGMFGSHILYISSDLWLNMFRVYNDGSGQWVIDSVKKIPGIKEIKKARKLPKNTVVLAEIKQKKSMRDFKINNNSQCTSSEKTNSRLDIKEYAQKLAEAKIKDTHSK